MTTAPHVPTLRERLAMASRCGARRRHDGCPVSSPLWRTGGVASMAGRAPARPRRMASSGRGRLPYGTGSIRQKQKRNGGLLGLLSPAAGCAGGAVVVIVRRRPVWRRREFNEGGGL